MNICPQNKLSDNLQPINGSAFVQSSRKCSNMKVLANIEREVFLVMPTDLQCFDLGPKNKSKISHACVPITKM
jgi:hypothetical protein